MFPLRSNSSNRSPEKRSFDQGALPANSNASELSFSALECSGDKENCNPNSALASGTNQKIIAYHRQKSSDEQQVQFSGSELSDIEVTLNCITGQKGMNLHTEVSNNNILSSLKEDIKENSGLKGKVEQKIEKPGYNKTSTFGLRKFTLGLLRQLSPAKHQSSRQEALEAGRLLLEVSQTQEENSVLLFDTMDALENNQTKMKVNLTSLVTEGDLQSTAVKRVPRAIEEDPWAGSEP